MVVWYLVSIIGFSIHSCTYEDVSYLGSAYSTLRCETTHSHDISVSHHIHDISVSQHISCEEQEACVHDCCKNTIEVLDAYSIIKDDDILDSPLSFDCINLFDTLLASSFILSDHSVNFIANKWYLFSDNVLETDFLSENCIFRI